MPVAARVAARKVSDSGVRVQVLMVLSAELASLSTCSNARSVIRLFTASLTLRYAMARFCIAVQKL